MTFSKGMRQRVLFAQAVLSKPPLLIMDEPTNGLDPFWMQELTQLLKGIKQEGHMVVFSTHQLEIADDIADQVIFMNHGRNVGEGSTHDFCDQFGSAPCSISSKSWFKVKVSLLQKKSFKEQTYTYNFDWCDRIVSWYMGYFRKCIDTLNLSEVTPLKLVPWPLSSQRLIQKANKSDCPIIGGKAVMINFWASWCTPCVREMPLVHQIAQDYQNDVETLFVNVGNRRAMIREFMDKQAFDFR
ncbi:AAA family ATPase [Paenibacillus amylolyticus]|nr:AAA family ATPase [Paenibacillus amylolyticus]